MVKATFRTLTEAESLDRIRAELENLNEGIAALTVSTGSISRSLNKIADKLSGNKS